MQTDEAKVVNTDGGLFVNLPLTKPTGKIRIKRRSFFAEYGEPIAPRQVKVSQSCYAEWQIGYDLLANTENAEKTSITDLTFVNYKGETKYAYELSEIVLYAHRHGLVNEADVASCISDIRAVADKNTFEERASISRTNPKAVTVNGLSFYEMNVSYPLFVHRFGQYEILAEIMIREKQRAVGTQAMLYVCLPVTAMTFSSQVLGRTLHARECAEWRIGREEAALALELFRVFGMLSPKHRHDVTSILKMLFPGVVR